MEEMKEDSPGKVTEAEPVVLQTAVRRTAVHTQGGQPPAGFAAPPHTVTCGGEALPSHTADTSPVLSDRSHRYIGAGGDCIAFLKHGLSSAPGGVKRSHSLNNPA
ncbi:unnamed protein product [Boreogadus saida]